MYLNKQVSWVWKRARREFRVWCNKPNMYARFRKWRFYKYRLSCTSLRYCIRCYFQFQACIICHCSSHNIWNVFHCLTGTPYCLLFSVHARVLYSVSVFWCLRGGPLGLSSVPGVGSRVQKSSVLPGVSWNVFWRGLWVSEDVAYGLTIWYLKWTQVLVRLFCWVVWNFFVTAVSFWWNGHKTLYQWVNSAEMWSWRQMKTGFVYFVDTLGFLASKRFDLVHWRSFVQIPCWCFRFPSFYFTSRLCEWYHRYGLNIVDMPCETIENHSGRSKWKIWAWLRTLALRPVWICETGLLLSWCFQNARFLQFWCLKRKTKIGFYVGASHWNCICFLNHTVVRIRH